MKGVIESRDTQMKWLPRSGICKNNIDWSFIPQDQTTNTGGRLLKARNTKELEFTLYFVLQTDLSRKIHDNHRKDSWRHRVNGDAPSVKRHHTSLASHRLITDLLIDRKSSGKIVIQCRQWSLSSVDNDRYPVSKMIVIQCLQWSLSSVDNDRHPVSTMIVI